MYRGIIVKICFVISITITIVTNVSSQDNNSNDNEYSYLDDLRSLSVNVYLNYDDGDTSLLRSNIKTDIELRLRSYGIGVSQDINSTDPLFTSIDISIIANKIKYKTGGLTGSTQFFVDFYLTQPIVRVSDLSRLSKSDSTGKAYYSPTLIVQKYRFAPVRRDARYGYTSNDKFNDVIRNSINDMTDSFINDYLRVQANKSEYEKLRDAIENPVIEEYLDFKSEDNTDSTDEK